MSQVIRHRAGKKEGGFIFIDSKDRKVTLLQLAADVERGWRHFWRKRGGAPMQGGFRFGSG
jgi:hypothetical protein